MKNSGTMTGLLPLIDGWEKWLKRFWRNHNTTMPGDTLGTMFCSFQLVVLTTIASGSKRTTKITSATLLPAPFVATVLDIMSRKRQWNTEQMADLRAQLGRTPIDIWEVEDSLECVMERIWDDCWSPGMEATLHELRAGHQYGGRVDNWVDED